MKRVPIVEVTANAMKGASDRHLAAGMDGRVRDSLDPTSRGEVSPEVPVLDYPALLERCTGRTDLADRLLHKFVEVAPADLEAIARAVAAGDAAEVAAAAHRLKGAAASLSVERIRAEAAILESLGWKMDLSAAACHIDRCRGEMRRLGEQVSGLPASLRDAPVDGRPK